MSQDQRHEIAKKPVVYHLAGTDLVTIRRDTPYKVLDDETLTIDVYYPPEWRSGARTPAVLFVIGFPDAGMQRMLGCKAKEMESYISWARLAAASGMVAITYTNKLPATDVFEALQHVRQNAGLFGIDERRIGVWACSGNVPTALSVLIHDSRHSLTCAVLCYGYMLDLGGSTFVADAQSTARFANPSAGKSIDDLPHDLPMFIARAGRDETPHLNDSIDRFVAEALRVNLPVTVANHPTGPHAFDITDDSEMSRQIVRQILAFMTCHLLAHPNALHP